MLYLACAVTGLVERNVLLLLTEHSQPHLSGVPISIRFKFHLCCVVKQLGQMPLNLKGENGNIRLTNDYSVCLEMFTQGSSQCYEISL